MLRRITISNYLLIESLDLELAGGLTVITGETGSGKSMLIDALHLALGSRADSAALRDPSKRAIIEVEVDASHLNEWFLEHDVPFELITSMRRQIEPNGRSRAFVNDTPVRLEVLRDLGARLIHIHSQNQTRLLNEKATLLRMLDNSAGIRSKHQEYVDAYTDWVDLKKELSSFTEQGVSADQDIDYLLFQRDELEGGNLEQDDLHGLESQLSSVMGVEKCNTVMMEAKKRVNVTYNINTVKGKELEEIVSEADSNYEVINDRINSFYSKAKLPKS